MRLKHLIFTFMFSMAAAPAMADGHLVGTWNAVAGGGGAIAGGSDHDGKDVAYTDHNGLEWTLKVEEQKGPAFHAQWCSQNKCEDAVGVERMNGDILMADEDGTFRGTVMKDVMELCYLEADADLRVADCHILQKGK